MDMSLSRDAQLDRRTFLKTTVGRHCAIVCWALLLAVVWRHPAVADEKFISREFGFAINFPVKPEESRWERRTSSGLARFVRFRARHRQFRTSITVATFDRGPFTAKEVAIGLALSRKRQLDALNGDLVGETDISIAGHLGKELLIAIGRPGQAKKFRYRVRTYYVRNRQYLMSVIGTEESVLSKRSTEYLNSFALVEPATQCCRSGAN